MNKLFWNHLSSPVQQLIMTLSMRVELHHHQHLRPRKSDNDFIELLRTASTSSHQEIMLLWRELILKLTASQRAAYSKQGVSFSVSSPSTVSPSEGASDKTMRYRGRNVVKDSVSPSSSETPAGAAQEGETSKEAPQKKRKMMYRGQVKWV